MFKSKFTTILLMLVMCIAGDALAQKSKKRAKKKKKNFDGEVTIVNESEKARDGKRAQLGLGVSTFTTAFSAGAFIDRNLQVNVGYIMPDYSSFADFVDMDADKFEANAKVFLGNSFYIEPGVFSENFVVRDAYTFDGVITGDVESSTFGAQVHIGNQWMWDQGFFIDVRWIGSQESLPNPRQL